MTEDQPVTCPACGAPLKYSSQSWKVVCEYCGYSFDTRPPKQGEPEPEALEPAKTETEVVSDFSAPNVYGPDAGIPGESLSSPAILDNETANQALNLTKKWVMIIAIGVIVFCFLAMCLVALLIPVFRGGN